MPLEDIPFDEQVVLLDWAAGAIVEAFQVLVRPAATAKLVQVAHDRTGTSVDVLRMGVFHAQRTGRIRRDYDTWKFELVA